MAAVVVVVVVVDGVLVGSEEDVENK